MSGMLKNRSVKHIKGRILAELADTNISGTGKAGLLSKALKRIQDMLDNNSVEVYDRGIDKLLKLLPYALPKIGYDKPLIANSNAETSGNSFQQVNIYLENRLSKLGEVKQLISGGDVQEAETVSKSPSTTTTESTNCTKVNDLQQSDEVESTDTV